MKEFGLIGIPLSVEVIVKMLALSLIPLVRGDCGGLFEFVGIPLSVEVNYGWCLALCFILLV